MSDKKVKLDDLAAEGAEDVKGGAATLTRSFANISIGNSALNISSAAVSANQIRSGSQINVGKIDVNRFSGTVMCPW